MQGWQGRSLVGLHAAWMVLGAAALAHAQSEPAPAPAAEETAVPAPPPAAPAADPAAAEPLAPAEAAPSPAAAAAPDSPVGSAPTRAAPAAAACVLGAHDGIADADATTSAALVCEALLNAGATVEPRPMQRADAAAYPAAYRIDMRALGKLVVLAGQLRGARRRPRARTHAAAEQRRRGPGRSRAPGRLARARQAAREHRRDEHARRRGDAQVQEGVRRDAVRVRRVRPGDPRPDPGRLWRVRRLYYEATRYAVGADLRVGGSGASDGDASLVGVSVGGRYFLGSGDITPFFGCGARHPVARARGRATVRGPGIRRHVRVSLARRQRPLALRRSSAWSSCASTTRASTRCCGSRCRRSTSSVGGEDSYVVPIALLASYSLD